MHQSVFVICTELLSYSRIKSEGIVIIMTTASIDYDTYLTYNEIVNTLQWRIDCNTNVVHPVYSLAQEKWHYILLTALLCSSFNFLPVLQRR
jgi:hypothetical protein